MSAGDLTVEALRSFDDLPGGAWDDLAACSPAATVFQGEAWNRAWWETRGRGDLALLAARRGERLVGLAPLFLAPADGPLAGRSLRFVGAGNADYLDLLAEDGDSAVVEALLAAAPRCLGPWARFEMSQMPPGSALRLHLERGGPVPDGALGRGAATPCPGVLGRGDPAVYEALARKSSLKRHAAALGRVGTVTAEHLREAAAIRPHLEPFFRQHVERWAPTPFPSLFLDAGARAFYAALVERLAPRGEAVFTVLRAGERAVAYHLGFLHRGRFVWYKPTFDLGLFRCSPGEVLLREILLFCARERVEELDFTRGDEAFKQRFADHVDENVDYVWSRRPRRDRWGRAFAAAGSSARAVVRRAARGTAALAARVRRAPVVRVRGPEGAPDPRVEQADLDPWIAAGREQPTASPDLVRRAYEHAKARRASLVLREGQRIRAGLWVVEPSDGSGEPPEVVDAYLAPGAAEADLAVLLREAARRAHAAGGPLAVRLAGPLRRRTLAAGGLPRA